MKDHRQDARLHDVRHLGCSPSSEVTSAVVRGGHPALDCALARAAARNAAQPPMSTLRAASLTLLGTAGAEESPAPVGRTVDAMCVTARRDDASARVVHVATVRDIPSRTRWYRVRVWRELVTASAN